MTVGVYLPDPEAVETLGESLARAVRPPAAVGLEGPLGAGKTTLVRAWLRALGHEGRVRSPTFTLLESYEIDSVRVHHLDLYRIADPEEIEFLGLRELLADDALWLIEWPDRGAGWLPPLDLVLRLDHAGSGRRIEGLPSAVSVQFPSIS